MSKIILALIVCFCSVAVLPVTAQKSNSFIGGNILFGFPNGDFKNGYKGATGIEASAGIGVSKIYFLGTVGYTSYRPVSSNTFGKITVIPLKAGVRVYATKRLFITGNAGYGFLKDESMESRQANFMYDAGVGLHLLLGQMSVHYDAWQRKNNSGTSASIQLKFGIALK